MPAKSDWSAQTTGTAESTKLPYFPVCYLKTTITSIYLNVVRTPHVNAVFLIIYVIVMQCPCKSNIPVQCTVFTSNIIRFSAELS